MSSYKEQKWYKPDTNYNGKKAFINARIIDPETDTDIKGTLICNKDKIEDFGNEVKFSEQDYEIIDCNGHALCPGLLDIQVHFREPGQTQKETIETGSKSAVAGGITRVVCQPNTAPTIDNLETLQFIQSKAKETSYCHIDVYACISKNMKGEELTEMGKLAEAGVVGFTDDGLPVMNAQLMRRALSYSSMFDLPIVQHAEDLDLTQKGCINEGDVSFKLGVRGIPNISESVIVARDIQILELTGGRYHVLHVSTKESIEAIRWGKSKGLNVTCEVAPHHFCLTDEAVLKNGTYAKMNPPLRSEADRKALEEALIDGTIDAIATDHAPHDEESKSLPLEDAAFGIVGVETMLPLSLRLYHEQKIDLVTLLAKMTNKAADIIRKDTGRIKKGAKANLTLIDLDHEWKIDIEKFASKSKNSPFDVFKVKVRAIKTIIDGQVVYEYV